MMLFIRQMYFLIVLLMLVIPTVHADDSTKIKKPNVTFTPWQTGQLIPFIATGNDTYCYGTKFYWQGMNAPRAGRRFYFPLQSTVVVKITGFYYIQSTAQVCNAGTGANGITLLIYKNVDWAYADPEYQTPLTSYNFNLTSQGNRQTGAAFVTAHLNQGDVVGIALTTAYPEETYFQGGYIGLTLLPDP